MVGAALALAPALATALLIRAPGHAARGTREVALEAR
jgi:hypothetical protein